MSIPAKLDDLVGRWSGINRLYTTWIPENPVRETPSVAVVEQTARGRFLKIEYDWRFEESIQEGLMLIGDEENTDLIRMFWIDSWHLSDKFLVSEGRAGADGITLLKGFYSVPDHPDWGWNTVVYPRAGDSFRILMYNVSPEGEEMLAVEMEFTKPQSTEEQ